MAETPKPVNAVQVARQQARTQLNALRTQAKVNRVAANAAAAQRRYIKNHPNAVLPQTNITPGAGDGSQGVITTTGTSDTSDAYTGGGAVNTIGGASPVDIPANQNTQDSSAVAASTTSTNTYLLIGIAAVGALWLYLHYRHG